MANARDVNFSNTNIYHSTFDHCYCSNASFNNANIWNSSFEQTDLKDADFRRSFLINVQFVKAIASAINFSYGRSIKLNFREAELVDAKFSHANFTECNFHAVSARRATFKDATMLNTNFNVAMLLQATFAFSDLKNSTFTGAEMELANLSYANLKNAKLTDNQLRQALSIRGAQLPDGSIGTYMNLLSNGHAECNRSLSRDWKIETVESIAVTPLDQTSNNCVFIKNTNDSSVSTMSQIISFGFSILVLIDQGRATAVLHAIHSTLNLTLSLTSLGLGNEVLEKQSMSNNSNILRMLLNIDTYSVLVTVEFFEVGAWCDNINLHIEVDDTD